MVSLVGLNVLDGIDYHVGRLLLQDTAVFEHQLPLDPSLSVLGTFYFNLQKFEKLEKPSLETERKMTRIT